MPWLSYDEAREIVAARGFASQTEFYAAQAGLPDDIPSNPRAAYGTEWKGWAHWLGKGPANERPPGRRIPPRPFEQARELARPIARANGLRNGTEWAAWARDNGLPEGVPADPYKAYRDRGWGGWPDWLGRRPARATGNEPVRPYHAAREFARGLGLASSRAWYEWAAGHRPDDIPYSPDCRYADEGWIGWGDFLGYQSRWTHRGIVAFLDSLAPSIDRLDEVELYLILSRNGMLRRDARLRASGLLRGLTRARTREDLDRVKDELAREIDAESGDGGAADRDAAGDNGPDDSGPAVDDPVEATPTRLRALKSLRDLAVVDEVSEARIVEDPDVLDFLVRNRVAALWQAATDGDPEGVVAETRAVAGGPFTTMIRDRFLEEHAAAMALPDPAGYGFRDDAGNRLEPNPMQRLTALRLLRDRRLGNWSGVGAGKTQAAILSAALLDARLTVVVAANRTLEGWGGAILRALPEAAVHVRDPRRFAFRPGRRNFLVMNYDSFQQAWSRGLVESMTSGPPIDFLVLDEVQFARQRREGARARSLRRETLESLVAAAASRNPELRILGMSATPVVNNLREAVKLLELVVPGRDFSSMPVGASVANAIGVHLRLREHGIRHRPRYPQRAELTTPELDGSALLPRLMDLRPKDLLRMEQTLMEVKVRELPRLVRRGTMIYTQYVEGIVEMLQGAVERAGLRHRTFTGRSRAEISEFLEDFRAGEADVLIGSAPVGTGVDGLQEHLDRLIFVSLPWSNAEYEQIVGRLLRQGSRFDQVEVIVPLVVLREERAGLWSWDDLRLRCIEYKRTLADAALDGVIPEGGLPSREELQRRTLVALKEWAGGVGGGIPPAAPA
ncbi:helicase-related protein [Paludisphaera sp.]|uniref:DEAD/DEAH box helicase n=1 Tax=Paludisphaera sp. TaxID=2017432 RepID=UPI00301C17C5